MKNTGNINWPLSKNNITSSDLVTLNAFLDPANIPQLTHGRRVRDFEAEFSSYIGMRYAVMVNSGASANLLSMFGLKTDDPVGEIIVPAITWVSDITSIIHAGFSPKFVDIDPRTFGMLHSDIEHNLNASTRAIFSTHCLGFDAGELAGNSALIPLIEDCCESLGATRSGRRLGSFGLMSNFSFYYAHQMSTIEGGMICTDDEGLYNKLRMLRSHGLVRECDDSFLRKIYADSYPYLDPQFIFSIPGFNVRPTEINAVIGHNQLKRLEGNNLMRTANLLHWLRHLDMLKFRTDYAVDGSSNFALPLVLNEPEPLLMDRVIECLKLNGVEYRRGTAGGGNQLRQPYAKKIFGADFHKNFPNAEHVHLFGLYIGNFPGLASADIEFLCGELNKI